MIDFLYRKNRKTRKNNISIISITQPLLKRFCTYIQKEIFLFFDIDNEMYKHVHSFIRKFFSKNSKLSSNFSIRRYLFLSGKKSLEVLNGLSLVQLNLVWTISFHYLLQIDPFHFPSHFEMSYLGLLKALLYTKSQKTLQIFIQIAYY